MAQFGKDVENITASSSIKITATELGENYTIYVIKVTLGPYSWTVKHRYSDFHDLHEKLCSSTKLDRNLLPPKKLFGNQSESFIKKRQHDLEVYLQNVLYFVSQKMPNCFATFLNFDQYEIHGITQVMAEELYNKGDVLLQSRQLYKTSPLHLYALTERLKLPEPTCESGDVKRDLGHILDFITRLKCLQVVGQQTVGTSNIDMNSLQFDLTLFKSLQMLELTSCNIGLVGGLDIVKQTLHNLTVNKSIASIKELLLQDLPHWKGEDGTLLVTHWTGITQLDFSHNSITEIDDSVQLVPKVERLDLSNNKIMVIQNLQWLSHMVHLDLSYNSIEEVEALHSKLGNLKTLNLAGNKLRHLQGLSKLFSLETLDLSYNQVAEVEDIKPISRLPCVEELLMIGNPVTITLDYRTKSLALFGDRVRELSIDKKKANQKELDTVAVLQAIQKSKDKAKEVSIKKGNSSASISDMSQSPASGSLKRCYGDNSQSSALESSSTPTLPSSTAADTSVSGTVKDSSDRTGSSLSPGLHGNTEQTEESMESNHSSFTSIPLPSSTHFVNISSLPDHTDMKFNSTMYERLFGLNENSEQTDTESLRFILWCPVIQYSTLNSSTPCCVVLTGRRIFILQVKNAESSLENVPALETFYILPLCNIQQILIGPCCSYVRVEESFVGASGTFAFAMSDSDAGKGFFDELKSCCENEANSDAKVDVVNYQQDCDLTRQIFETEEKNGECTGRIAFAANVHRPDDSGRIFLLMSENYVYVIKSCVLFWPKPTFDMMKIETGKSFEIIEQFSVEGKISEIKPYLVTELNEDTFPPVTPTSNIQYQEFGLSMVFHEALGFHSFDYQFLSTKARDTFLSMLSMLKAEHAHRMSPTLRQEPEGGNESGESLGDGKMKNANKRTEQRNSSMSSKTDESDIERLSDPESSENENKDVPDGRTVNVTNRKVRAHTEIVIPKIREQSCEEGAREVPSYTLLYLSPELTVHLEKCVQNYTLFKPISHRLQGLTEMNGEHLANFFHSNIVPVGVEGEELHHILWTNVVPYTCPTDEIVTCVMLSNQAVYLVSDRPLSLQQKTGRPSWMTHARHVSDSVISLQSKAADKHHSSGILLSSENNAELIRPYCILDFKDIQHVNVGLFDQCVRLTGNKRENVFTLVTRNSETTSVFMKTLSSMLSLYIASPMLDLSSADIEQDFYKAFNQRTKTTIEGMEYVHPSKVKFLYPGDEAISDLLFLINEHLRSMSLRVGRENILQYIVGYKTQLFTNNVDAVVLEPVSIILTNECLCFVTEDLVSYPLPDFVRGLPSMPRHRVIDVKKIEYLKCIKQNTFNKRDFTLVFSDEKEDIILVPGHYSLDENDARDSPPDISVRVFIQSERESRKFLSLVQRQWEELHPAGETTLEIVKE